MDVQELMAKMGTNLSVTRAFGAAYEKNGAMIIPVAMVAGGGGGGEGTSPQAAFDENGNFEEQVTETPSGSGAGFGGIVLPVGAYVVKDDNVRWIPAFNANLLIIAVLATVRLLIRSLGRRRRRA